MSGRTFIEFSAITGTTFGIIFLLLPGYFSTILASLLVLTSIGLLIGHYWVTTEPEPMNRNTFEDTHQQTTF